MIYSKLRGGLWTGLWAGQAMLNKNKCKTGIKLIILSFLIFVNANSFAQTISLNERNTPFETVINKIQLQSNYDFIGNTSLFKTAKPVSLSVNKVTLKEALDLCFENQEMTYTLKDKTVVIKKKEDLSCRESF